MIDNSKSARANQDNGRRAIMTALRDTLYVVYLRFEKKGKYFRKLLIKVNWINMKWCYYEAFVAFHDTSLFYKEVYRDL